MLRTLLLILALTAGGALPALAAPPACAAAPGEAPRVRVGQPFQLRLGAPCDCSAMPALAQVDLLVKGLDTGLHPLSCDPAGATVTFILNRNASATAGPSGMAAWEAMLGDFWSGNGADGTRQLAYSLVQQGTLLGAGTIALQTWSSASLLMGTLMLLAVWAGLIVLGKYSGMLRDPGGAATAHCARSYSLGRVQMAWWFAIVIGAYIFLWTLTGQMPVLSAQALALAGLSSVTGLTAAALDAGQQKPGTCSSGLLLRDLLTDAEGVTIYRFQLLVSNVLFGLFFLVGVVRDLAMPELDTSVLTLLGMSAATYTGFKIPERQGPPPGAAPALASAPAPAPAPTLVPAPASAYSADATAAPSPAPAPGANTGMDAAATGS